MNYFIIIIEAIVCVLLFTTMILIPLVKNPVWWIADYPEEIQEEYFKTHDRIPSNFYPRGIGEEMYGHCNMCSINFIGCLVGWCVRLLELIGSKLWHLVTN